jgi:hypothetical protein
MPDEVEGTMNDLDDQAQRPMVRRRWFQFSLRSLMAAVVVNCLGLGGWHLLLKYGQYVEAEPAVVGQPIKIRGRFLDFGGQPSDPDDGRYTLTVYPNFDSGQSMVAYRKAKYVGCWVYETEDEFVSEDPGDFKLTLKRSRHSPIRGSFVVRAAD